MSKITKSIFSILTRLVYGGVAGLVVFGLWLLIWEVLVFFLSPDNILIGALSDFRYLVGTLVGVIVGAVFFVKLEISKDGPEKNDSEESSGKSDGDPSGEMFEESSGEAVFEEPYEFADNLQTVSKYEEI